MDIIALFFVISGITFSILVYIDIKKNGQSTRIMGIVWPLTMLWASWIGLLAYISFVRVKGNVKPIEIDISINRDHSEIKDKTTNKVTWETVALSTIHCGVACTVANIVGETLSGIMGLEIILSWALNYVLVLIFAVCFKYMAIKELKYSTLELAIRKTMKLDFLSLTAWQIGVYGFVFFTHADTLSRASFDFWFIMQLGMMAGFIASYPMNMLFLKNRI